ncbi:hypothetical protein I302_102249 [Kwoniella bestiolae CBS 10118]|uniref:Small nuclear ribonucleoprotein Prp3 C-terminal domain-containing protein n=1 Tax=Kwoniella bestiolae CBS 10118 TaxID=1296100 RepID=A0A1B9GEF2_9TREE|nr:hypothetical protein I302_00938 [Kwoniella bestiolae CBS 10118]OCF29433.1 hypothetical protein I302_00938 [Kwoniella bestiolae CBS 10118]
MSNPPELEAQLDLLQLLTSMYTPTELLLPESTQSILDTYLNDPSSNLNGNVRGIEELKCELTLPIDEYDPTVDEEVIFQIHLPTSCRGVRIRPKQPLFLNRSQYESLLEEIPVYDEGEEPCEYILSRIEAVKLRLQCILAESAVHDKEGMVEEEEGDKQIDRVWFWLPSLSTREKRDDMVNFAKEVGLTGFVLAGKPGILCVEGNLQVIDKYMSRIKSESWSDIPKHHKKITERLRRPLPSPDNRAFTDMKEITDIIPHYGQYNHRGDMSEVKRLMDQWGVGDDFGAVVMNSGA